VESAPDKGSVFTLRLPMGKEHFKPEELCGEAATTLSVIPDTEFSDESVSEPLEAESPGNKIVVVEDNHEITDYVSSVLSERFNVISASNGKEGLEIIRKEMPDLIIADLMMPEMDGLEMTRRIKEDSEQVIFLSFCLRPCRISMKQIEGIKTGAEAYVLKPFHALNLKELATRS
jgi:CheY-like chemotaxis protein